MRAGHLSTYASLGDEEPYLLFGWVHDVVVLPHWFASGGGGFRQTVRAFPGCRGLAVAHGWAVALGTDGQIDVVHQGIAGAGPTSVAREAPASRAER